MFKFLDTLTQTQYQLVYLAIILFTVIICTLVVFAWIKYIPKRRKRKRRHHGHGRINPTRAEIGGMPEAKSAEDHHDAQRPPSAPSA